MEVMALIEIDDVPRPPFISGIFHGELLNNQMVKQKRPKVFLEFQDILESEKSSDNLQE